MLSLWSILLALASIQLVVLALIVYFIRKIVRTPTGAKLLAIAGVFAVQSIIGLVIYNEWRMEGYGVEISGPLIALQAATLIGLIILLDIVRK